jgi:hypothetical protein
VTDDSDGAHEDTSQSYWLANVRLLAVLFSINAIATALRSNG